jgi:hypothetical protein
MLLNVAIGPGPFSYPGLAFVVLVLCRAPFAFDVFSAHEQAWNADLADGDLFTL